MMGQLAIPPPRRRRIIYHQDKGESDDADTESSILLIIVTGYDNAISFINKEISNDQLRSVRITRTLG